MASELYMKQLHTGFCLTYLIASFDETYPGFCLTYLIASLDKTYPIDCILLGLLKQCLRVCIYFVKKKIYQ